MSDFRIEKDSMGEIQVPAGAYYGAQTRRAADNFPISNLRFSREFIEALGLVKRTAAVVNRDLGLLEDSVASRIIRAAEEVSQGDLDSHFVVDIFQTGSGTSTNMNANEVIANRANKRSGKDEEKIHPNDHVNYGQSSNDVIPTAIRVAAVRSVHRTLVPALKHLLLTLQEKGAELSEVVKTGRTHLMDAMPVTVGQELSGYARQIELGIERIESALERMAELPQGGTAVGTGINTHPEFGKRFAGEIASSTGHPFREAQNHFEAQATVDAPVELSGQLKTVAVSLLKIANDMRWMNSGPNSGLGEIELEALQPGSSIMPGKVNPVIEESVAMVCAQVIGNDAAITIAGQSGNFELNVMLPVVAHNLLESIQILGNAVRNFADRSLIGFRVREERLRAMAAKNPILVTALNPLIGYDLAARIAKKAFSEERAVLEVALEMTDLSEEELRKVLEPIRMTRGGFVG
ncbi:MAG: class II fumarate hydratase [Balneolaceae bacterium]